MELSLGQHQNPVGKALREGLGEEGRKYDNEQYHMYVHIESEENKKQCTIWLPFVAVRDSRYVTGMLV